MLPRTLTATLALALAGCSSPTTPPQAQPAPTPSVSRTPEPARTPTPSPTPRIWGEDPAGARICLAIRPWYGAPTPPTVAQVAALLPPETDLPGLTLLVPVRVLRMAVADAVDHPGDPVRVETLGQRVDEVGAVCLRGGYWG